MGEREQVALLRLSSWCLVMEVWLFLAVPWVCLRFVIVVFPDHIHLLIFGTHNHTLSTAVAKNHAKPAKGDTSHVTKMNLFCFSQLIMS